MQRQIWLTYKKKKKEKESHFDGDPEYVLSASTPAVTGLFNSSGDLQSSTRLSHNLANNSLLNVLFHVKELQHVREKTVSRDSKKRERKDLGLLSWIYFINAGLSG